jgi:serine-type D-Ala-D-Ala carboxypeptidase/endopeptidase (penicillin-binding protein 4)
VLTCDVRTRHIGQGRAGAVILTLVAGTFLAAVSGALAAVKPARPASSGADVKAAAEKDAPAEDAPSRELAQMLDRALMPASLKANMGACVVEIPSGKVIYEKNADAALAPASNMKLVTTAVALDQLGAKHKLQTRLVRRGDTLALIGGANPAFGDPNLADKLGIERTADYTRWVKALAANATAGEIRNFVFDDSILDSQWRHPSWSEKEYQHWYCAPVGGLIINDSCVDVEVDASAGKTTPLLVPACSLFEIINKTTAGKGNGVIVGRPTDSWQLVVSGHATGRSKAAAVTVPDPGMFAASVLCDMCKAECCPQLSGPQRKKITDAAGNLPPGWEVVGTADTELAEVLQRCNTDSQNLFAETLMKLNGAVATGGEGSWASGRVAVAQFLRKHDLPDEGVYIDDGSGLSTENRVTPRLLASLLCRMHEHADWDAWHKSLAVGGENGTLRRRFKGNMESKVIAKTGFIRGVSSLSGYIEIGPDKYVAFSFIYNNVIGWTGNAKQAEDQACQVLYRELADPDRSPRVARAAR